MEHNGDQDEFEGVAIAIIVNILNTFSTTTIMVVIMMMMMMILVIMIIVVSNTGSRVFSFLLEGD